MVLFNTIMQIFEDFFDDVEISVIDDNDNIFEPDTQFEHTLNISLYPFYFSRTDMLDIKTFELCFNKICSYSRNCILFDKFDIKLNYNYKSGPDRKIGTIENQEDFIDLIKTYNNTHTEGWARFEIVISFNKNNNCSFDKYKRALTDVYNIAYKVYYNHFNYFENLVNLEYIKLDDYKLYYCREGNEIWNYSLIDECYKDIFKIDSINKQTDFKLYNGPKQISDISHKKCVSFKPGDILYSTQSGELVSQKETNGQKNIAIAVCVINEPKSKCVQFVALNYLDLSNQHHGSKKCHSQFYYPCLEYCGAVEQSNVLYKQMRILVDYDKWSNTPLEDEDYVKSFVCGADNYLKMMNKVNSQIKIDRNTSGDMKHGAAILSYKYFTKGTNMGDWYIPSVSELYRVCQNWTVIEQARYECGAESLMNICQSFMTSNEYNKDQYLSFCLTKDKTKSQAVVTNKNTMNPVILFLQIKK